jgi:hypothetical protein
MHSTDRPVAQTASMLGSCMPLSQLCLTQLHRHLCLLTGMPTCVKGVPVCEADQLIAAVAGKVCHGHRLGEQAQGAGATSCSGAGDG